jgi:hypothetical protein
MTRALNPTLPLACSCPAGGPIVAVRPGQDAVRRGAVDLFNRKDPLVEAEVRDQFWCAACAPWWRKEVAA